MICLETDKFINEEEKIIKRYRAILSNYTGIFHSYGCNLRLRKYWEDGPPEKFSYSRIPFNQNYRLYVLIEVVRTGKIVWVYTEEEDVYEVLFSKRMVSCIRPKTNSIFNLFKKNIELEMHVLSGYELGEEEEELITDLNYFLQLLKEEFENSPKL